MHQWPPRHARAVCIPMPNPGGGRPCAAAAQPSDSRALPSLASQARGCSPCACSHRRARLAAGRSSATTPWPPPTTSTAPRCAAALTALSPRRPRPRRRPRRPPPCARGCRCHRQPARPRCRPRRPRRRRPRPRRPPPFAAPPLQCQSVAASRFAYRVRVLCRCWYDVFVSAFDYDMNGPKHTLGTNTRHAARILGHKQHTRRSVQ